jgi:UDP-GlcNAc:undecaprenyl-phosphate/decaprenyl-phosphate GlcNAc-1-phosphate transferase
MFSITFTSIALVIFSAICLTLLAGWAGIIIAKRFGLMDIPGAAPHKLHNVPTPYAGGIALILSLLPLIFLFGLWQDSNLKIILILVFAIFLLGLWDDIRSLTALIKLLIQLAIVTLLVVSDIRIKILEYPTFYLGGPAQLYVWLDYFLTFFWIIGITNAFNLVDSMDGLAVGLSGWAFAFFMLATYDSGQLSLTLISAIFLGICIGLHYYNVHPARLFLGDSAALTLGFILAVIAILYTPQKSFQTSSWFVPILLVAVPIFDTSLVVFSRMRRGRPFYKGGLDHTYHRLVALGLEPERAVMAMQVMAVGLECLAVIAIRLTPLYANVIFAGCLLVGLGSLVLLDSKKRWE